MSSTSWPRPLRPSAPRTAASFAAARIVAESRARAARPGEVTLAEIYAAFEPAALTIAAEEGLSVAALIEREVALEYELAMPDPEGGRAVQPACGGADARRDRLGHVSPGGLHRADRREDRPVGPCRPASLMRCRDIQGRRYGLGCAALPLRPFRHGPHTCISATIPRPTARSRVPHGVEAYLLKPPADRRVRSRLAMPDDWFFGACEALLQQAVRRHGADQAVERYWLVLAYLVALPIAIGLILRRKSGRTGFSFWPATASSSRKSTSWR